MSDRRSTASSFLEVFSLNPLPYPVLLFLAMIFMFLGFQWYLSYEEVVESTEKSMGWLLLTVPVVLIIVVRLLSKVENPERIFWNSPWDPNRGWGYYYLQSEGSSPWGVAALIILLLVLVQFQSTFLDSWFI